MYLVIKMMIQMCCGAATALNLNVTAILVTILNYLKCSMMPGRIQQLFRKDTISYMLIPKHFMRTPKLGTLLYSVLYMKHHNSYSVILQATSWSHRWKLGKQWVLVPGVHLADVAEFWKKNAISTTTSTHPIH